MFTANKKEIDTDLGDNAAYKAGSKVREFVNHANQEVHDRTAVLTRQIKDKPVESSVIALAIGFLLGAAFRR